MSAAIQIQVYMPTIIAWDRWDQVAEAIAFGAGVPTAECLLAAMEAFLLAQISRLEQADLQAKTDAEKQQLADEQARQTAELERQRQQVESNQQAEFERQKRAIDLEIYAAQQQQQLEIQRLEAQAKLEAQRAQLEARLKRDSKVIQPESKSIQSPDSESRLIQYYRLNPRASQRKAAQETGISQSSVNRILSELESSKVIHRNGNGVEVL
jgi:membrane protein involved in colicin uptake